jgi:hypothetical protein
VLNSLPAAQTKKWHGLSQLGAQELGWHCIITHWTYIKDMEWFRTAVYFVNCLQTT